MKFDTWSFQICVTITSVRALFYSKDKYYFMFLKILHFRPTNRSTNDSKHIMKRVYFKTYLYNFWANSNGAKYYFKLKRKQYSFLIYIRFSNNIKMDKSIVDRC